MRPLATTRLVAVGFAVVVTAGLVASSDAATQPVDAAGSRRNIVVIITDDMRTDQIDTMPTVMSEVVGKGPGP
jgi:hypothetical protein